MANTSKDKSTSENKLVRMTFDAPSSLRKAFKVKAASEDKDMKDVFCDLMRAYIDNRVNFKKTRE